MISRHVRRDTCEQVKRAQMPGMGEACVAMHASMGGERCNGRTDRQVALKGDVQARGVLRGVKQLQVQVVLQVVREPDAGVVVPLRAGQPLDVLRALHTLCGSACVMRPCEKPTTTCGALNRPCPQQNKQRGMAI